MRCMQGSTTNKEDLLRSFKRNLESHKSLFRSKRGNKNGISHRRQFIRNLEINLDCNCRSRVISKWTSIK